MILVKLFKTITHAAKGDKGRVCPKCGSTETEDYGPYWRCYRCDYEW